MTRPYLRALALGILLCAPQLGCGKSDDEVIKIVQEEKAKTAKALKELQESQTRNEKLKKDVCALMCIQLKQLQSIGPYVGSGRQAEYNSTVSNLNNAMQALGCPSCE
jgi:hypothetical protein